MSKATHSRTTATGIGQPVWGSPAEMEAVMNRYATWLEDWGRVQQESLDFFRARLTRDAEAAAKIAACKTPADLVEWQISFTKDAVEDYMRQGQKITELFMQSTNGGTR